MTLNEKLGREDGKRINVYKQGVFWVAYEESAAMLCCEKALKVRGRYEKQVGREILSVGFPEATLEYFRGKFGHLEVENGLSAWFATDEKRKAADMEGFRQKYRAQADVCQSSRGVSLILEGEVLREIRNRICSFPLSERTPMQAMLFIQELQKMLTHENTV